MALVTYSSFYVGSDFRRYDQRKSYLFVSRLNWIFTRKLAHRGRLGNATRYKRQLTRLCQEIDTSYSKAPSASTNLDMVQHMLFLRGVMLIHRQPSGLLCLDAASVVVAPSLQQKPLFGLCCRHPLLFDGTYESGFGMVPSSPACCPVVASFPQLIILQLPGG
ncbi:uncharacterized protein [Lolium perenne]|uniref:uncharacterized protein isoform X1 n=1 Tax=Lolium perenne TaxID=4522 RepID=UPI0021F66EE6|nr:uncharacterized protein LOC127340979 isoform X1 [Lolium perenne]